MGATTHTRRAATTTITTKVASEGEARTSNPVKEGGRHLQVLEVRNPLDTAFRGQCGSYVHPLVRGTLDWVHVESPVGGRLRLFSKQWKRITNDPAILNLVNGWEIEFHTHPQEAIAKQKTNMAADERLAVEGEIAAMLEKGAIEKSGAVQGQVLSGIFLREKKDGSSRPILNLKGLNDHIPYIHFKMETLKNVKDMLKEGDWMVKIDLKDAYFTLPLQPNSRKYVRFRWGKDIYQFLCLCFGLGPAPRLFTKLMKVPMTIH